MSISGKMYAMKLTLTVQLAVKKISCLSNKMLATIHAIIRALNNVDVIVTQSVIP